MRTPAPPSPSPLSAFGSACVVLLAASALAGCAVTPKNEPSLSGAPSSSVERRGPSAASPSASAGATGDTAAPASASLVPEDLIPRGPTLLAGPFRADETDKSLVDCKGMRAFALYGDPQTRVLDGVWMAGMLDCTKGYVQTVEGIPTAARVVDAFSHANGAYAVLESVATRAQPGGLRTVLDLADPQPTGIVPPADRASLLPLLPPAPVFEAALFAKDRDGILDSPPPRGARVPPVDQWLAPDGLVVEDVFQDHFALEIARRGPRDPRMASLARQLREDPQGCRGSHFGGEPRGVCWKHVEKHGRVAIVRPPSGGTPVIRAVGNPLYGKRVLGTPAPPLTIDQHRAALQAFADRQPVRGELIAAGPLGPWGGSIGVLLVTSPAPRAYVLRVDGPAMSIDIPDPFRALPDALREGGKTEALVLTDVKQPSRVLLRVDRAPKRPWTALTQTQHPLEDERRPSAGRDIVEDERSVFRLLAAKTIAEAETIVRTPPVHATAAELAELFKKLGDRKHLLAHAAKDAVFIQEQTGTNLGDANTRPLADVNDDVLDKLARFAKERGVTQPVKSGDELKSFFEQTGPVGPHVLVVDVWLTREDGKLRVLAVVDR